MIKKLRYWFQIITQTIKRHGLIVFLGVAAGVAIFFGGRNINNFFKYYIGQTINIGVVGKYNISNLPPRISHMISYGLTEITSNGMATSSPITSGWTVKDEGKEYLFNINPEIYWQDGEPFKKEDVYCSVPGSEIITSEKGVHIKLDSAFSPLPSFLDSPIFKNEKIGLGPFRIKKARISRGNFSSLLLVSSSIPKKKFLFKFYPNEKDLITAFKLGEIEVAFGVSDIEQFADRKNLDIQTESEMENKYVAIFFNTRKKELSSKRVRQSLAYAIEKPGKKDRAISPIAPSSWAYNNNVKTYDYDPKHAKELLENEAEQLDQRPLKIFSLPELIEWAEKAKKNWQENLGIETEIHVSSFVPNKEEFDIFLGFGIIPSDPDQYPLWHSTQQSNFTGINSPRIDQLLEKGRKTVDQTQRKEIYNEFQQAISEEVPAIFLFYPPSYTVSKKPDLI